MKFLESVDLVITWNPLEGNTKLIWTMLYTVSQLK